MEEEAGNKGARGFMNSGCTHPLLDRALLVHLLDGRLACACLLHLLLLRRPLLPVVPQRLLHFY